MLGQVSPLIETCLLIGNLVPESLVCSCSYPRDSCSGSNLSLRRAVLTLEYVGDHCNFKLTRGSSPSDVEVASWLTIPEGWHVSMLAKTRQMVGQQPCERR